MALSTDQWHRRYLQQAQWTHNIRSYLYQKCRISQARRILDVGSGTGVLERELSTNSGAHTYGVDIDLHALRFAITFAPGAIYSSANCLSLPFCRSTFDVTLCHFLLLWIAQVQEAVEEMVRVTTPGGAVLALAEPDYGGRIDFPFELQQLGEWQSAALKKQGAEPLIGRQLSAIFSKAGLVDIEVGVLGGQWKKEEPGDDFELEWQVISSDLQDHEEFRLQSVKLKTLEISSRKNQHRILFVPVFYAYGQVHS